MLYLKTIGKKFIREVRVFRDRGHFVTLNGNPVITNEGVIVELDRETLVIREEGGVSYSVSVQDLPGNSVCEFNGRGIQPILKFDIARDIVRMNEGDRRIHRLRKAGLSHLLPLALAA